MTFIVDNKTSKNTQSSNSIQELANSVKFMSLKFDDFNLTVSKILIEMKEIRIENENIMNNNKKLN